MRVAVVTETYPPEVNGVALTAARFVDGLRQRAHEIDLVRPRQHEEQQSADVLVRGAAIPGYPNLKMGLPAKRALERLWSGRRPDVVHIVTEGPLGWSALRAAIRLRLPVVSDFRTNFHSYSRHYGVGWLHRPILAYLRKFHNRTLCTMVPTERMRGELATLGFRRLRVVARGVDTARFDPARRSAALRASWGAGPQDPVVVHVGRLAAEKNLGTLLDAFEQVRLRVPPARLVLVGDGPARREVEARCPDAVFAGMRHGEDLAAHYASGDLFLFPSMTETYGNVTLEALASGLAVVAYDYAAASAHIRHGDNGLLAALGDATAFCTLAAGVAGDPARLRALGERARQGALTLDWGQVVRELEAVLETAAGTGDAAGYSSGRTVRKGRWPMVHIT